MKNQDVVKLFQFVVQEVDRLQRAIETDWKAVAPESWLYQLPASHDRFAVHHYHCGKAAALQLYELAASRVAETKSLKGRVKVETLLQPIQVELAQRAVAKREPINEKLVKAVLAEAEARAKATLEDRTYFFPVYTIAEEGIHEYAVGAVRFVRTAKFFGDNEAGLKRSEDLIAARRQAGGEPTSGNKPVRCGSDLFQLARAHYAGYRWIAGLEIKGAEPAMGWVKAREILESTLSLLRLAVPSRAGLFVGLVDENPTPRSASYMSLKSDGEFDVWHTSSYAEPHVTAGFLGDYQRKAPQLVNVEAITVKMQHWEELDAIEDRLLTALFWFNEAWKETNVLPKIVKFSTCIESLFSTTTDLEAIAERSAERLAWLSFPTVQEWHERRETYRTMKSVYGARSKAVHGNSAAKTLKNLPLLARQAEEQASLGIFAFSQLPPLFRDKNEKEKLLNEFFVRLKLEGLERARQVIHEEAGATPSEGQ